MISKDFATLKIFLESQKSKYSKIHLQVPRAT